MKAEERTWFPFIMTGLTIAILGVYLAWGGVFDNQSSTGTTTVQSEEVRVAPTDREYQTAVLSILSSFEDHQNPGQSYEELLNVTVPDAYRETHLELVVSFAELDAGKVEAGNARIDLLRQEVNWLP